jgi:hypothetical protein
MIAHMKRGAATLMLAGVAVVAVAGCGKSKPTKSQYLSRANAICAEENRDLKRLAERGRQITRQELINGTIRIRTSANVRLRKIAVPTNETKPAEWLHQRETAIEEMKKIFFTTKPRSAEKRAAGVAYNNAVSAALRIAVPYGLTSCINFAAT